MGVHTLVVFDGATNTWEPLDCALTRDDIAELTVLYVIDPFEADHAGPFPPLLGYWGEWYTDARARAESTVETARNRVDSRDIPVETLVERGRTATVTVDTATEYGVDHIVVVGADHNVLSRITGTTAQHIVREAPAPVTVV